MGAGKSTIARLIDFCLGGKLEYTPALQQEFVAASLELDIEGNDVFLNRRSEEKKIHAQWTENQQPFDVLVPKFLVAGRKGDERPDAAIPHNLLFYRVLAPSHGNLRS